MIKLVASNQSHNADSNEKDNCLETQNSQSSHITALQPHWATGPATKNQSKVSDSLSRILKRAKSIQW